MSDIIRKPPSFEAIFRYGLVSQVLSRVHQGVTPSQAISDIASIPHQDVTGHNRPVSVRTLHRWLAAYRAAGIEGLEPLPRPSGPAWWALGEKLREFAAAEKKSDPAVSLPEIIKRAVQQGIVSETARIDRTTLFRTLQRIGVSLNRRKKGGGDVRRFAFAHRMEMILCDGKHFRAGAARLRRVAFFYLDDATRYGLEVVVGTAETSLLFLTGLREVIRHVGLPVMLYLDHGPGFIAHDSAQVAANLGTLVVHGTVAYPQGHGKIERFHQTALNALLRGWDGRPDVKPDCESLRLRLRHWLTTIYNHTPHESLAHKTPFQRFHEDQSPLRFPDDQQDLDRHFMVSFQRRVSPDNVVAVDSLPYEMPHGHAGTRVMLYRRVLHNTIHFLDQGRMIELKPADLVRNARDRRGQPATEPPQQHPAPPSAADSAFQRAIEPMVGSDGGFPENHPAPESDTCRKF